MEKTQDFNEMFPSLKGKGEYGKTDYKTFHQIEIQLHCLDKQKVINTLEKFRDDLKEKGWIIGLIKEELGI